MRCDYHVALSLLIALSTACSGDDDAAGGGADAAVTGSTAGDAASSGTGGRPGMLDEAGASGRGGRGGGTSGSDDSAGAGAGGGGVIAGGVGGGSPQVTSGWTEFAMQLGATAVYVSNDGNDGNDGTEDAPLATFTAGFDRLRDGQADWLLLRRGDTFVLTGTQLWNKSGPPDPEDGWMRLGAYGDENDPRPIIDAGSGFGIEITPGYRSDRHITSLAFTDIHFLASARLANPAGAAPLTAIADFAIEWRGSGGTPFQHLLFENLRIEGYNLGLQSQNDAADWRVRRCIITELFAPGGADAFAAGMLTSAQGVVIEDNVFYRIQHPGMPAVTESSFFSHAAYITAEARDVVARGNFMIHATEGLMVRAGGTYVRNVSAHNPIAVQFGQANGVTPTPGGVPADIRENLLLNSEQGANIGNVRSGQVLSNMLVRDSDGSADSGMNLIGYNAQGSGFNVGIHDTDFSGNYLSSQFNYSASMGDTQSYSGLTFSDNTTAAGTVDASIADFLGGNGIAGDGIEDLAVALLTRDRANYPKELTTTALINHYRRAAGLDPIE